MFQFQCNIPENSCLNLPLIHVSFEECGYKGLYLKCVFPTQYIFYHLLLFFSRPESNLMLNTVKFLFLLSFLGSLNS